MSSKTMQFESLLEAVPDALVGMDHVGGIRFVNHQTESLFGYDRDDLVGQPIQTLVPESLWEFYSEHSGADFADPRSRSMDLDLKLVGRQHDGTELPVNISLSYLDTGDALLAITAASEVTGHAQALDDSKLLAAIVENSNDAIIAKTLDGIVTTWNPAAERMYGYSREEMLGTSVSQLSSEGRTSEMVSILARIKAGLDVEPFESVRVRRDGTVFPVLLTVSPIRDGGGAVVGASTITRDMTVEKEAFEAARSMIESSLDALVAISPEGLITDANEATVKATGIPRVELIGTAFSDCFTEPAKAKAIYQLVFEKGMAVDYPLTMRHRDGTLTEVLYNASVYRDGGGKVLGVFAAARDVTEARQAFEATQRLAAIVENSDDAIISSTLEGVITSWNPAAERLYGYSSQEIIGESIQHVTPADRMGEIRAILTKVRAGEPVKRFETLRIRRNGSVFPASLTVSPIRDPSGAVTGASVISRDVTEQKRAAQAVERARDVLRATMDSLMDPHVLFEAVRDERGQIVDFRFADANPAACAYDGIVYQDLVGSRMLEHYPGVVGDGLLKQYADVVESGQPIRLDDVLYAMETMGGENRYLDISAVRVGDGLSYAWRDVTDRHVAAARLAESQKQYRHLAENASDVVYRAGPDRRIVWIAPSVSAVLGWDPDELVGTQLTDLTRADFKIAIEQDRVEFYSKGHDVNPEGGYLFELRTKSGDYRWMSGHAHALTDPDGTPAGIVVGLRDVDDLVRARQEAQAGEAVLRATRDSLMDPHILLDAVRDESGQIVDFVFVDANPAVCAYFDMDYLDLIGDRLLSLFPGHADAGLFELYAQVVETSEPLIRDDFLYSHELLQAERRYDIRAAGVGDGLCVSWRDVTQRYEAAEYASWMAAVVEQTHDAIIGASFPDTLVTSWNPAAERMYGYTAEEIMGKTMLILNPKDNLEQAKELATQLSADEAVTDLETVRIRKDGSRIPVSMSSSPIRDADGVTVRMSMIHRDITKERAAREEAQALTSALKTSNDSLRDFVAVASHDLRSPLVIIGGFTQVLTDNWGKLSEEDRLKHLGAIQRGVGRLSRLTNDLLTSAKVEAEAEQTRPKHLQLAAALASHLEADREELGTVGVTCPPELAVVVDPAHLTRILDNYLRNAFKYGEPPICIEAERVGDFVEVRVCDHGPGVPPDFINRLFTKFGRAATPTTRAIQGTGLGLSIVKTLAEANHGDVRYQHNEPSGGCFVVRLPTAVA